MVLLVLNCLLDETLAQDFNLAVEHIVAQAAPGAEYTLLPLPELGREDLEFDKYTHLLVSGSEASVLDDNPWDGDLAGLITSFVQSGRCVLGICYGHQFIVRTLAGRKHARHRSRKVWGWLPLEFAANHLYENTGRSVCLTVNSDEVFDLPREFKVLASLDHCRVMAYQYGDRPVWGVQFHPEYGLADGDRVIEVVQSYADPESYTMISGRVDDEILQKNTAIFERFFKRLPD